MSGWMAPEVPRHLPYERLVIGVHVLRDTLRDNRADRGGAVAHQGSQAGQGRTFHLEVGDTASFVVERLDLFVQVHVVRFEAHPAALRGIEARSGDGDTFARNVAEMLEKRLVGIDEIGARHLLVPARMLHERLFEAQVADRVAALVVAQQAVEAARCARKDEFADLDVGLDGPRSAEADQRKLLFHGFLLPCRKIDVGQGVQLRDADVDVTDADAGREDRHAFAFIGTRHCFELAVRNFTLLRIEIFGNQGHAAGVAYQDHRIGQLAGLEVQMEN